MKRFCALLLCCALALSLAACGDKDNGGPTGEIQKIDANAPAHEQLLAQAENYVTAARQKTDVGLVLQGEYFYEQAQAAVSSLRHGIDNLLWLMGEGENLAEVTAGAPYRDWDSIVAAGMCSPTPYYFEGLIFEVQGKTVEAQTCYARAQANPTYEEMDFYYLRNMSVEELYALRETVLTAEIAVYEEYTPRTTLCTTARTGMEYSPAYHLALAQKAGELGHTQLAWRSARNALLTNPVQADLYGPAVGYGLNAETDEAMDILNEGLLAFPEDGALNYLAGAAALADGDTAGAQSFLTTAQANSAGELNARCQSLLAQIGGG